MNKRFFRKLTIFTTIAVLLSLLIGCAPSTQSEPPTPQYPVHAPETRFKIATTTSLYDTGLWYYLEPMFEEYADVEMDIIYAGTGIALEYGRRGDVDAVIVHDRAAEDKFIAEGYGINRRNFAYNFFLIAGPAGDPAGIKGATATEAFKKIYQAGMNDPNTVKFISRGDNSGTHSKEKLIWSKAGYKYEDVEKSGKWHIEAGKGMGPTLLMSNEEQAYVLADISTFLAYTKKTNLTIVPIVEEDPVFLNVYAAIAANPDTTKVINLDIANKFINWLISAEIQNLIGTYGKAEYGRSLFFPLADGGCKIEGCPSHEEYTKPVP
ncbi:MAG: tungsten ABC transporter substrate-binding protein [Chloroflexi bacterium]|nr:tungsten ABC transporter substrate-binding protein [Chloroflexota bacterium]